MPDIKVVKGKTRAYIFSETAKGKEWLCFNTIDSFEAGDAVVRGLQYIEGFVDEMVAAGLIVEQ